MFWGVPAKVKISEITFSNKMESYHFTGFYFQGQMAEAEHTRQHFYGLSVNVLIIILFEPKECNNKISAMRIPVEQAISNKNTSSQYLDLPVNSTQCSKLWL